MKKLITSLLAILATLVMAVSVAAEGVLPATETSLEPDENTSYSEKHQGEPECKPNCEGGIATECGDDY